MAVQRQILLTIIGLFYSLGTPAAEPEGEPAVASVPLKRLAEHLELAVSDTPAAVEITWLAAGNTKALALFESPDSGPQHGAVITLLGVGQILEQSEFSTSIRQFMAAAGWATLIVQTERMDERPEGAEKSALANALLKSAIAHVGTRGYSNIVVVAHGTVAQNIWPAIQSAEPAALGFVGIDEWSVEDFAPSIPILNVVNRSLTRATSFANKRFSQLKKNPSAPCELFFYDGGLGGDIGFGQLVAKRIRGWVERHFNGAS